MVKTLGQKISMAIALLCYLAAVGCVLGAIFYQSEVGQDPIRASLMASVVFFVGAGGVLHVIATTRLKGIISGREPGAMPGADGS